MTTKNDPRPASAPGAIQTDHAVVTDQGNASVWPQEDIDAEWEKHKAQVSQGQSPDALAQAGFFYGRWLHDADPKMLATEFNEDVWEDIKALDDMPQHHRVLIEAITAGQRQPLFVWDGSETLPAAEEYKRHQRSLKVKERQNWHLTDLEAREAAQREHERRQSGEGVPEDPEESLRPIDLGPYLRGEVEKPTPSIGMMRTDELCLLYPGKEHAIIGEMESGKTWYCLACAAAELRKGHHVVYYHFEESEPSSTIERLMLLGVSADVIDERFHFIAPDMPVTPASVAKVRALSPSLVILDGKNEAMHLHSLGARDEDGAAGYRRRLVKPFTRHGAAVLSCDHVVKDKEARGRNSFGSVAKDNGVDGTLIMLETVSPFGRDMSGRSSVFVAKDRPGYLRRHGKSTKITSKTFMGTLIVDDTEEGREAASTAPFVTGEPCPNIKFLKPARDEDDAQPAVSEREADDAHLLDVVTKLTLAGRSTQNAVYAESRHGKDRTKHALERLETQGRITKTHGPNRSLIFGVPEDQHSQESKTGS